MVSNICPVSTKGNLGGMRLFDEEITRKQLTLRPWYIRGSYKMVVDSRGGYWNTTRAKDGVWDQCQPQRILLLQLLITSTTFSSR